MTLGAIKAFGLKQVKITDSAGGNVVTLPAGMVLSVREEVTSEEFEAEGIVVGSVSVVRSVRWELEAGGISLAAYARLTGRTASSAGSTPNETLTLGANAGDVFPYVRIYGRSVGDAGDDVHCKLYKAKVSDVQGVFRDGEFWVSSLAGLAMKDASTGKTLEFVQHETAAGL